MFYLRRGMVVAGADEKEQGRRTSWKVRTAVKTVAYGKFGTTACDTIRRYLD
jgi:hypothetical protein